jgi:hypothetical protein
MEYTSYYGKNTSTTPVKLSRGTTNTIEYHSFACSGNGKNVICPLFNKSAIDIFENYFDSGTRKIGPGYYGWWKCVAMSDNGKYVYYGAYRPQRKLSYLNNNNVNTTEPTVFVSEDFGKTLLDISLNVSYDGTNNIGLLGSTDQAGCLDCSRTGEYVSLIKLHRIDTNNNHHRLHYSINYGRQFTLISDVLNDTNSSMSRSGKYVAYIDTGKNVKLMKNTSSVPPYDIISTNFINKYNQDCSGGTPTSVKISGNGKILLVTVSAVYSGTPSVLQYNGGVFISKDVGQNWTNISNNIVDGSGMRWINIKCSENGQYITVINNDSMGIYTSNNFGNSWSKITTLSPSQPSLVGWIQVNPNNQIVTTNSGQCTFFLGNTVINPKNVAEVFQFVLQNYTYSYTPIKIAYNNTFQFTFTCTLYDCSGTYYLKNENNQTLSTKVITDTNVNTITFTDISTNSFDYGMSNLFVYKQNDNLDDTPGYDIQISDPMVINATCFLEGTKILAMDSKRIVKYIPIEKLKPGMLVKTLYAGFVPIKYIGFSTLYNPGLATRVRDQLFVYKKSACPELREDLVLTGNHSVLVDTITDEERAQIIESLGDIYVTDRKYRLPAFNDKRAEPYDKRGDFRIWNLALENENYYGNYGIYANGLLVETTSCRYLKEISRMTLVEKE